MSWKEPHGIGRWSIKGEKHAIVFIEGNGVAVQMHIIAPMCQRQGGSSVIKQWSDRSVLSLAPGAYKG